MSETPNHPSLWKTKFIILLSFYGFTSVLYHGTRNKFYTFFVLNFTTIHQLILWEFLWQLNICNYKFKFVCSFRCNAVWRYDDAAGGWNEESYEPKGRSLNFNGCQKLLLIYQFYGVTTLELSVVITFMHYRSISIVFLCEYVSSE